MDKIKELVIESGNLLISENDISRKLYILKKGKVRVFKKYKGGKIVLAILGPGEIFGELSFFDSKPRSASVEAITDIVVECIDGEDIELDIEALPSWLKLVFNVISTRFRVVDQQVALLKSSSEYESKDVSKASVANTIYSDILSVHNPRLN